MVFVEHCAHYPEHYRNTYYRVEPSPQGGWDVYLDPPANPIGPPLVEAIDDELAN